MKLLVSIHDVMADTLDRVRDIVERLHDAGLAPVTLLVCPGTGWDAESLQRLRELVAIGCEPAGHGWTHEARDIRGWRHRLHSALISRNAAEHLALTAEQIEGLMLRCHAWFEDHGLPAPTLYVPPAWAMGPVPRGVLERLPYERYETLAGVYEATTDRFHRLPMAGYETDTVFRAVTVRAFNALNFAWARATSKPLRLGIHPNDFSLKLAGDLERVIERSGEAIRYSEIGTENRKPKS
ncbi:MAG: polysaccharide deacetylase family protein [Wenzhouxiangellaceae bacterium]|nr:polysaccharide deacetylase family protein [Wenzhouxiangellaceae bacterium]